MNALTNVLLAVQCAVYGVHLRKHGARPGALEWSMFFLFMSAATAAGVVKHGMRGDLGADAYRAILAVSNVMGGLATYWAQSATIRRWVRPGRQSLLSTAAFAQAALFLTLNAVVGPDLSLLIANTVLGLVPVILVEGIAAPERGRGSDLIAGGLLIAGLAGGAYVGSVSVGRWFNHIDVAHAIMAVSFHVIQRGVVSCTFAADASDPCRT